MLLVSVLRSLLLLVGTKCPAWWQMTCMPLMFGRCPVMWVVLTVAPLVFMTMTLELSVERLLLLPVVCRNLRMLRLLLHLRFMRFGV